MDFDDFTHSLIGKPPRRGFLRGLGVAVLMLLTGRDSHGTQAKQGKKHKHRKKRQPPPFNVFGCLDVGQTCNGNNDLCCSGVCEGEKPKKGKQDRSQCVAHNAGGCTPERSFCADNEPFTASVCNLPVATDICLTTTGNAGFCTSLIDFDAELNCRLCSRDTDCLAFGFPPGSACVLIRPQEGGQGCSNNSCAGTDQRACVAPAI
jgi:Conotoxin